MSQELLTDTNSQESLIGQVADEFLERQRLGEKPTAQEYIERYPEAADLLRKVLTALELVDLSAVSHEKTGATAEAPPGGTLGDYRIIREVGRGGMGVVYQAKQLSLGRKVALKVLPFAATLDQRQLQRFHNEARAAACLHHPNIVPVYAVGCKRGVHYYAMQFIEGQSLEALIAELRREKQPAPQPNPARKSKLTEATVLQEKAQRNDNGKKLAARAGARSPDAGAVARSPDAGAVARSPDAGAVARSPDRATQGALAADTAPEPRAQASTLQSLGKGRDYFRRVAELGMQAAEALEHAHQSGVIHRDIKPANLMLDGRSNLWITDFGLAQFQSDTKLTITGDLVGTLRYMSPEQALAKRVVVDQRTDVYSLGATLYELMTLTPVFAGKDRQELLRQIAFEEPAPPRKLDRHIPVELETVVLKALEKNPADRYATAKALADDLKRFLNDEPTHARRPTLMQRARKWAWRHQAKVIPAAAAAILVVAVVSGTATWWLTDRANRQAETERAVTAALDETYKWQSDGKIPQALAVALRADATLNSGIGTPMLQQRTKGRLKDLQFASDLEEVRALRTDGFIEEINFFDLDFDKADQAYSAAFRAFGIDVEGLAPEEAAKRIQSRSVAVELAAALDDWCIVLRRSGLTPVDETRVKRLLALARAADPDVWRNKMRDAVEKNGIEALKKLLTSLPINELSAATVMTLSHALHASRALEEEVKLLREAQKTHAGDFWINYQLAYVHIQLAKELNKAKAEAIDLKLDESIRFASVAVALRPGSVAAHNTLAAALVRQKRFEEACASYREAIRLKPDGGYLRLSLAGTLEKIGRKDEAEAVTREALKVNPKLPGAYYALGIRLRENGEKEMAIVAYEKALELLPNYANAHNNLAILLIEQERWDEAIAHCKAALEKKDWDPTGYAFANLNLGRALCGKGDFENAVVAFRTSISHKKDHTMTYGWLGETCWKLGHEKEAMDAFEDCFKLNSKDPRIHDCLALVFADRADPALRDVARALDHAMQAVDLAKKMNLKHKSVWFALGVVYYRSGDWQKAVEALKQYEELEGKGARSFFFHAMACWKLGEKDHARKFYEMAVDRMQKKTENHPHSQRLRAEAAELLEIESPKGKDKRGGEEMKAGSRRDVSSNPRHAVEVGVFARNLA